MLNLVPKIFPPDKALHFIVGVLIAWPFAFTGLPVHGFGVATAFAIGKEIWDRQTGKGTPEIIDAVYTISGALIVALL